MVISKSFLYSFVVLFLAANHSLITYFFKNTPMVAWKQFLGMSTILYSLLIFSKLIKGKVGGSLIFVNLIICTYFVYGYFNIFLDVTYINNYVTALSIFFLLFYLNNLFGYLDRSSAILMAKYTVLYLFIGFIFDSQTEFFNFLTHNFSELYSNYNYRPVFTIGSSSLLFSILGSLTIILNNEYRKNKNTPIYIFIILMCMATIFVSGSRSSFFLYLVLISFLHIKNLLSLTIIFIIFTGIVFYAQIDFIRFISIFNLTDPGNFIRLKYWILFLNDFTGMLSVFGHGIGYLGSESNIYNTNHFESSFIALFVELGVFGIILLYFILPIYILRHRISFSFKIFILLIILQSIFAPIHYNFVNLIFIFFAYAYLKKESLWES